MEHEITPTRAAVLIDAALGEIDSEHPIWLELSLLSEQMGAQAKRVTDAEEAARKSFDFHEQILERKVKKLKNALTYVSDTHKLLGNPLIKNEAFLMLSSDMLDVVKKTIEEVDSFFLGCAE